MGKGQDFTPLRDALAGKAKGVFLIGVDAPQIRPDLDGCGLNMTDCATWKKRFRRHTPKPKRAILCSQSACASFDMFKGYAHRSEVFIEAFKAL